MGSPSLSLFPFWCSLAARERRGEGRERAALSFRKRGKGGETSFFSPSFHAAEAEAEAAFLRTPPGTRTGKGGMEEVSPNRVLFLLFIGHNAGPPYIVVHCIYMFGESLSLFARWGVMAARSGVDSGRRLKRGKKFPSPPFPFRFPLR